MLARRAKKNQIAGKIGEEPIPGFSPSNNNSNNNIQVQQSQAQWLGGGGGGSQPYSPLQQQQPQYGALSVGRDRESYSAGGDEGVRNNSGLQQPPEVPRFGRRARTVEPDAGREERQRQYQLELQQQIEDEKRRKEEEKRRRKQEDAEFEQRLQAERDRIKQKEESDMIRERQAMEDAEAKRMMGGKRKPQQQQQQANVNFTEPSYNNNRGTGGQSSNPASPLETAGSSNTSVVGRKGQYRLPPTAEEQKAKEEQLKRELDEQRQLVRQRKEREAEERRKADAEFERRVEQWGASNAPLSWGVQPADAEKKSHTEGRRHSTSGHGGPGSQQLPSYLHDDGQQTDRLPPMQQDRVQSHYGSGGQQQPSNGGGDQVVPPWLQGGDEAQLPTNGRLSGGGNGGVDQTREDIMQMLLEQRQQIQQLSQAQQYGLIPAERAIPIPAPTVAMPPPAHRTYAPSYHSYPVQVLAPTSDQPVRQGMAFVENPENLLQRFLREEERSYGYNYGYTPTVVPARGQAVADWGQGPPQLAPPPPHAHYGGGGYYGSDANMVAGSSWQPAPSVGGSALGYHQQDSRNTAYPSNYTPQPLGSNNDSPPRDLRAGAGGGGGGGGNLVSSVMSLPGDSEFVEGQIELSTHHSFIPLPAPR
jgi:hypothetical protein